MILVIHFAAGCRSSAEPNRTNVDPGAKERTPFLEPDVDHSAVLESIASAKESIQLESHWLADRDIIDALKDAQAHGVQVRVILDAFPAGSGTGNHPAILELKESGTDVRLGNPSYKVTDATFMVIDGQVGVIMGFDHIREAFNQYRGFGIVDPDPGDVSEMMDVFEADWKGAEAPVERPNLVWGPTDSRQKLTERIASAQKSLDIEVSKIEDDDVVAMLLKAAQRQVVVRVLMSPTLQGPDESAQANARLVGGGVQLRLTKKPYINTTMMILDSSVGFIGSQKLEPQSLDIHRELGIFVSEKRIIDGLIATFTADWASGK